MVTGTVIETDWETYIGGTDKGTLSKDGQIKRQVKGMDTETGKGKDTGTGKGMDTWTK